jgi:hypothetical protein
MVLLYHYKPMNLLELVALRKAHVARLGDQGGMAGERQLLADQTLWLRRPKGVKLKLLLDEPDVSAFTSSVQTSTGLL